MADEAHTQLMMQQQAQNPGNQQLQQQQQQMQPQLQQQMQQQQMQQMQQQHQIQSQQMQPQQQIQPQPQMQTPPNMQSQQPQQIQPQQLQPQQIQPQQLQAQQLQPQQIQSQQIQPQQIQAQQIQPQQLQPQPIQPAPQQMSAEHMSATTSMPMNVTTSMPMNAMTTMPMSATTSMPVNMQHMQQNVNTTSGTPVQMQLTAQQQPTANIMPHTSQPHLNMMHQTMTMTQASLPQVQVIQQPLSASYLQHLYPQGQMLFPGNLTLQHASMTAPALQGLGAQGLSLQLQPKTAIEPKMAGGQQTIQSLANKQMTVNAGAMMTAQGQVIGGSQRGAFPQQMIPGKSTIIHSQTGYSPNNTNQTVVIGQFGVVPNQQTFVNQKAASDPHKGKTYSFHNQQAQLQPKSLYSSPVNVNSSTQVFNGGQLKQMASSQPQIITSQSPGAMFSQAQLLGLQTLGSLPPGLTWTSPGCIQPSLLAQNPIIIRSQQSDMFLQPQQAMPLPVAAQPVPQTGFGTPIATYSKHKHVRASTQSVAVATQTQMPNAGAPNSMSPMRAQIKPKIRSHAPPQNATVLTSPMMATSQTQTSHAANQTAPGLIQIPIQPMISKLDKFDPSHQTLQAKTASDTPEKVTESVGTETKTPPPKSHFLPSAKVTPTTVSSSVELPPSITSLRPSTPSMSTQTTETSTIPPSMPIFCDTSPEKQKPANEVANKVPSQPPEVLPVIIENEHLKPQAVLKSPVVPVKEIQKAIVKPQVLTHVIDGYVIQEGNEPFPISRSALLESPCRNVSTEKSDNKRKDSTAGESPQKPVKMFRARGNMELSECIFCGKLGPKTKFKRKKGFCSISCVKNNKKGLPPSAIQENGNAGRPRKISRAGRKPTRTQSTTESEEFNDSPMDDSASNMDEESSHSNKTEESNSENTGSASKVNHINIDKDESRTGDELKLSVTQKIPTKWTVQDVFEFIRDLPSCSDYADTFKSQEIDGQALLLLKADHLMTAMCMKLGPALKLIQQIDCIKQEFDI